MGTSEGKFYKQTTLPSFAEKEEKLPPMPEKIGPYKIETLLATGGTSLIYLGLEEETKKPRVVKVLSPEYVNHPEMTDHFLWEAKIIGLTDHPNIIKLCEYGKWEGGLYIGMEFIRGVSLRQFITQQSFSLKRCLDIILQVAYALSHLHTHGVIHRDLKPENILIAEDGEVKVIDFGIAQLHEDNDKPPSTPSQMIGTPSYMSPEQKENPANASFASDIFSLGVIAYELILGKLSYGMINLSLLPAGLQKILEKALAVSKSERYQDIVDFITDLTAYYTSPAASQDRPGGDRVLEILETLQKADLALSTLQKPQWPQFDIGLARDQSPEEMGLYLDFFQFANNTKAILIAHTHSGQFTSTLPMAVLRGMIQSLIHPHLIDPEKPFNPMDFATTLNSLICRDKIPETFHLSLLKLIPYNDTLIYLSCGQGPLFHVPQGKNTARTIHSDNPLIGEDPNSSFTDAGDTLNDGDLLLFHDLPEAPFRSILEREIGLNALLSTGRLAQTVLKRAQEEETYEGLNHPKIAIALQRIS